MLQGLLRRLRLYVFVEGAAYTCLVALLCFLAQIGLDYFLRLRLDLRAALLGAIVLVLAVVIWRRLVKPMSARIGITDAAAVLERKYPHLQSRLISAVQFARGEIGAAEMNSPTLINRVIEQACRHAKQLSAQQALNHHRARLHAVAVCSVLGVMVIFTILAPEAMGTWFERNILLGNANWRQNTHLVVLNDKDQDGIIYAPRGDDLMIRARVDGRRPRQVYIDLRFASNKRETHTMTAVGPDEFHFGIPRLNEPLIFSLRGGDARNAAVAVELVDRPRIAEATVTVYPPTYAQQAPRQLQAGQALIKVLHGSEIEIRFTANKRLSRAMLLRDNVEIAEALPAPAEQVESASGGRAYAVRFKPDRDASYVIRLTDERTLGNVRPRQFHVRLIADDPPTVNLRIAGVSDLVTPQATLPLEMSFKDRYGLAGAELVHQTAGGDDEPGHIAITEVSTGSTQRTTTRMLTVAELRAREGHKLLLYARASDLNNVTGPGVGTSARYTLRVVSTEELLAELSRRELEYRREFERLIDSQEQLRNDTLSAASVFERGGARDRSMHFATLERRQRQVVRQLAFVSTQFRHIYNELRINDLYTREVEGRLVGGIVDPLEELSRRRTTAAADLIDELDDRREQALFRETDRVQAEILVEMRRILTNMVKWEGFHETISLLQTIMRMQRELLEETDQTLGRQLEDLLERD